MNGPTRQADLVAHYDAALVGALHGPARVKARMIEEIRDGLVDTLDACSGQGIAYERAVRRAVREFGTPDDLVSSCQRELTIAQTRRTARTIALTAPLLIVCWYAIERATHGQERLMPSAAELLAVHLAGVAGVTALVAVAALVATGGLARRLPTSPRVPLAVAWTATTASAAMAIGTCAFAVVSLLSTNWPLTVLAGSLAAASHALMAASARACRACARLPIDDPIT